MEATQIVTESTGPASDYAFAIPDKWNGDLVVYGHGIVDPAAPIALPTTQDRFEAIRDALLARGFAVAYSSYSENGYALKDAAQRLHELSVVREGAENGRYDNGERRCAFASAENRPCFHRARLLRARPSGVRGPVLSPPCSLHRRFPRQAGA